MFCPNGLNHVSRKDKNYQWECSQPSLCSSLPFRHAIFPFLRGRLFLSGREVKFYYKKSGQGGRREDETEESVAHVEREFRVS